MAIPVSNTPWATGQGSTTDQLAQQLQPGQSFTNDPSHNPLYQGAYNPMYNAGQGKAPTLKDLASLYYKSQGQGVVGDNPHPFHAANVYRDEMMVHGGVPGLSDVGPDFAVKSPDDVKSMLQARIDLAGGDKKAVMDDLVGQVNQRQIGDTAKKAGLSPSAALNLQGKGQAAAAPSEYSNDGIKKWFSDYVSPYVQEQQAQLEYQANMFDSVANDIIPQMSGEKQQIMAAYLPLISQAYHQKASNFATNFLTSNDNGSLIGQLMRHQKQNTSILNFLNKQAGGTSGGGSGGINSSFVQSIMNGAG